MFLCMRVCMCVFVVCVRECRSMSVSVYMCVSGCLYLCACVFVRFGRLCVDARMCMYVCLCARIYVFVLVCMCL